MKSRVDEAYVAIEWMFRPFGISGGLAVKPPRRALLEEGA